MNFPVISHRYCHYFDRREASKCLFIKQMTYVILLTGRQISGTDYIWITKRGAHCAPLRTQTITDYFISTIFPVIEFCPVVRVYK
jgi:hypothetical protein